MAGKKGGRPEKVITPEMLEKVTQLASLGLTQEQIAHNIDLAASTFQKKLNELPELSECLKKGRDKGIAFVASRLMEAVKTGNMTAMIFYLKARAGWRENDTATISVQPLQISVDGKKYEFT